METFRMSRTSGVTPRTLVVAELPPNLTGRRRPAQGAAATTWGSSSRNASASWGVSVVTVPRTCIRLPVGRIWAGVTMMSSVPIAWTRAMTSCRAPCPTATIAITEDTPMTIPRRASPVRVRWTPSCRAEMRRLRTTFTTAGHPPGPSPPPYGRGGDQPILPPRWKRAPPPPARAR